MKAVLRPVGAVKHPWNAQGMLHEGFRKAVQSTTTKLSWTSAVQVDRQGQKPPLMPVSPVMRTLRLLSAAVDHVHRGHIWDCSRRCRLRRSHHPLAALMLPADVKVRRARTIITSSRPASGCSPRRRSVWPSRRSPASRALGHDDDRRVNRRRESHQGPPSSPTAAKSPRPWNWCGWPSRGASIRRATSTICWK